MKKNSIHFLLYAVAALALSSCINKDDTLLDLFPNETIVNPNVGLLINNGHIERAIMVSPDEVRGFSSSSYFETPDLFYDSLHIGSRPQTNSVPIISYKNQGLAFFIVPYSNQFGISADYGKTWEWHSPELIPYNYNNRMIDLHGLSDGQSYLALTSLNDGFNRSAHLHEYHRETGISTVRHVFGEHNAKAFYFTDDNTGWVLLNAHNGQQLYISRTVDGGHSWTDPMQIGHQANEPKIIASTPGNVLVYGASMQDISLYSTDGGQSFANGPMLSDAQYMSDNTIYAVHDLLMYKSEDAGRNWTATSSMAYNQHIQGQRLSFYDANHGIIYAGDRLFNTKDGGKTWEIAIFPYNYVRGYYQ